MEEVEIELTEKETDTMRKRISDEFNENSRLRHSAYDNIVSNLLKVASPTLAILIGLRPNNDKFLFCSLSYVEYNLTLILLGLCIISCMIASLREIDLRHRMAHKLMKQFRNPAFDLMRVNHALIEKNPVSHRGLFLKLLWFSFGCFVLAITLLIVYAFN